MNVIPSQVVQGLADELLDIPALLTKARQEAEAARSAPTSEERATLALRAVVRMGRALGHLRNVTAGENEIPQFLCNVFEVAPLAQQEYVLQGWFEPGPKISGGPEATSFQMASWAVSAMDRVEQYFLANYPQYHPQTSRAFAAQRLRSIYLDPPANAPLQGSDTEESP